jgi:hypothetical protein
LESLNFLAVCGMDLTATLSYILVWRPTIAVTTNHLFGGNSAAQSVAEIIFAALRPSQLSLLAAGSCWLLETTAK